MRGRAASLASHPPPFTADRYCVLMTNDPSGSGDGAAAPRDAGPVTAARMHSSPPRAPSSPTAHGPRHPHPPGRGLGALGLGRRGVQRGHHDVRLHGVPDGQPVRRPGARRGAGRRDRTCTAPRTPPSTAAEAPPVERARLGPRASPGIVVALLAPVLGQRTDGSGRRKLWLGINTGVVVLMTALMFFVVGRARVLPARRRPGRDRDGLLRDRDRQLQRDARAGLDAEDGRHGQRLRLGRRLPRRHRAAAHRVLRPRRRERRTAPAGFLHVTADDGLNIRIIALIAAAWTLVFSLPVLFAVPEIPANARIVARRILPRRTRCSCATSGGCGRRAATRCCS